MINIRQNLGYNITSEMTGVCSYRVKYDLAGRVKYEGWADPGSLEANPVWAIKQYEYDEFLGFIKTTKWANGKATFVNIWTNAENLTYA